MSKFCLERLIKSSNLLESLKTIPAGTSILVLANNDLGNKTTEELTKFFASIPSSVTEVVLTNNNLDEKMAGELVELFKAMPRRIDKLTVSSEVIKNFDIVTIQILGEAMPVSSVDVVDADGLPLKADKANRLSMFKSIQNRSMHRRIVDLGIELGYCNEQDRDGLCNGITAAWLSACLTGDEEKYAQRINQILVNSNRLLQYQKHKKIHIPGTPHAPLTAEEAVLIQILAFYEQIVLHQSPDTKEGVLSKYIVQNDTELISKLSSSENLEKKGGLANVYSITDTFTPQQFADWLTQIANKLDLTEDHEVTGFLLGIRNHTMGITYDTSNGGCFKVMDINQGKSVSFAKKDVMAAANMIFDRYGSVGPRSFRAEKIDRLAINVEIISTGDQHLKILRSLAAQGIDLDARHVGNVGSMVNVTLAEMATKNGNLEMLKFLADKPVKDFRSDTAKERLAIIAIENGHLDILKLLLDYGVDLNYESPMDETGFADIAVKNGHVHILNFLVEKGFNLSSSKGRDFALTSAKEGHLQMLNFLVDKGVVNFNGQDGGKLAIAAVEGKNLDILTYLADKNADLNACDQYGFGLAFLAAKNGDQTTLTFLQSKGVNLIQPSVVNIELLKHYAREKHYAHEKAITSEMDDFIKRQLREDPKATCITITPQDIAKIMGHNLVFKPLNRVALEEAREAVKSSATEPNQSQADTYSPKINNEAEMQKPVERLLPSQQPSIAISQKYRHELKNNREPIKVDDQEWRLGLIEVITQYAEKRSKGKDYNNPFNIGLYSKEQKLAAVSALTDALDGKPTPNLAQHLRTLRNGTLGKDIRTFIKAQSIEDIKTVRDLVGYLTSPKANNTLENWVMKLG